MDDKDKFFIVLLSVSTVFIISAVLLSRQQPFSATNTDTKKATSEKPALADKSFINVGGNRIYVETADTPQTRERGLSGREGFAENEGMLFDFGLEDTYPSFWMKDMNFNIDMIWIDDGVVVGVEENVPAPTPGTPDSQLPLYRPDQAIDYVLEVNAGYSDRNGIEVGDIVDLGNL